MDAFGQASDLYPQSPLQTWAYYTNILHWDTSSPYPEKRGVGHTISDWLVWVLVGDPGEGVALR